MGNLIDQIDTHIMKVSNAEWSSFFTPANNFSAYLYIRHFILGVLVRRAI